MVALVRAVTLHVALHGTVMMRGWMRPCMAHDGAWCMACMV